MRRKYLFVAVLLAAILIISVGVIVLFCDRGQDGGDGEELVVVTSFYPMYIAAENVIAGCDGVGLYNLSEPQTGCLHDYQLTPEDMKLLSSADILIINGGGIENFLPEVTTACPDLTVLDSGAGIAGTEENAHTWLDPARYAAQVEAIRDGLSKRDPKRADAYRENADAYLGQIGDLIRQTRELKKELSGSPVILLHEAYAYVAETCGLSTAGLLNLDEDRQVSAKEMADLMSAIRDSGASVLLAEERYGAKIAKRMELETGIHTVYLDPLVRGEWSADSYLQGMNRNMELLREAFGICEKS